VCRRGWASDRANHDGVGSILDLLDQNGLAENNMVICNSPQSGRKERMARLLKKKMQEIGDETAHSTGIEAEVLRSRYKSGQGIAAKAQVANR
jgi:hypothetical protein